MKPLIAITVHNRHDTAKKCIKNWEMHYPDFHFFIVDDGSDYPFAEANIRNDSAKGIAYAKNQCLEYARKRGYTDVFLADDDVFPLNSRILYKYINSGFNHMCLSYDRDVTGRRISNEVFVKYQYPKHVVYNAPCGLLLYCNKKVLASGIEYPVMPGRWGLEHRLFSERIHKAGLTPHAFIDVPNAIKEFYSYDYNHAIKGSVPEKERIESIKLNSNYGKF